MPTEITQAEMAHKLPPARLTDRVTHLLGRARGRSVIHVGFADARCADFHGGLDAWIHAQITEVAGSVVGLDIDADGVDAARANGHDAYVVDCTNPEAIAALDLEPAEVVIAGELIEHLDNPGGFLSAAHSLVADDGRLIITTPNAHGLVNTVAAIAGHEVNHPDHVALYSIVTLSKMLRNHGWSIEEIFVYTPKVKSSDYLTRRLKVLAAGVDAVLGIERLLARAGRPFVADGLIIEASRAR